MRADTKDELEEYLRKYPLQLRAARPSRPPRPGHPDFIGPLPQGLLNRKGAIDFDPDGVASFTIHKEPWERARDEKLLRQFGDV
jgi:hypothetical protein